ncbi:hypothetical protein BGZ60DRAFT_525207 [Tricladium varicosporioides]|nr:hypothetical protein BGZ60DRAFT_525207 [Hymenoscyphus varicosporioides]
MSLVALRRTPRTDNVDGSVTKSLELALSDFGSVLTDDERKELQQIKEVPDASAALIFTAELDASNQTRRGRSIGARAFSMLQSVQQFSAIVGTFVSSHPDVAALVWGSVKLTVLIAANITSYFESLADLHASDYKFILLVASSANLKTEGLKKVTTELRGKLRPQLENIQFCAKDVKKAIALAKATTDRQEQELQEQERKLADNHRKHLSIFASRAQKELENAREQQRHRAQDLLRKKRMKLLDSLSTYKHQKNFSQARKRRYRNTAMWLFSTIEFTEWKDNEKPLVFFLTGKIGSGKTVLTLVLLLFSVSAVIEYLYCERKRTNELTAFVLSRYDDSVSLSAISVLRSIIRQCLEPDDITEEVERQLSELNTYSKVIETTKTLLQYCTSKFAILYIIIDSLDEFETEERNTLLRVLSSVISRPDSIVKLFLVGRGSISEAIRKIFPGSHEKSTENNEVEVDIEIYIRENIALRQKEEISIDERLILTDPAMDQEIIKVLINGANGMFLWVDFQIAEICGCTCDNEIRKVLLTLPKSIGETFDRAMRRISKRPSAKTAIDIFRWVAATKRALTLDELREALSYEPGTPYFITGRRPNGLERVTFWCENLVQLDEEFQTVQFTHRSVLQHLLEPSSDLGLLGFHINLGEADHFIGEICVTYLNSNDFKTTLARRPAAVPTRLPNYLIEKTLEGEDIATRMIRATQKLNAHVFRNIKSDKADMMIINDRFEDFTTTLQIGHPFLEYARSYWLSHTHTFEDGKSRTWSLWTKMIRSPHGLVTTPWTPEEFYEPSHVIYEWLSKHDHFAVFLQFVTSTRLDSAGRIRLISCYARLGRLNYIDILIGLVQDKKELLYGLLYAAGSGHLGVVQRLLDAKADVNAADAAGYGGRTALQAAAAGGHLEVVQRLLDAKADVNAAARYRGRTALQAAATGGHLEVVQRLLDAKADVNAAAARYGGRTALQAAARYGGHTALQAAAVGGHLQIVALLKSSRTGN